MNSRKKLLIAIVAALSTITASLAIIFTSNIFDKPEHVHIWNEWVETTAPTCTTKGEKCRVCLLDETHVETETLPATGHTEIPHEAKTPTCTEIGWDEYVSCENCDYTTYVEIPANGHSFQDSFCTICNTPDLDYTAGIGLEYTLLDNNTYEVSGLGSCEDTDIIIPDTYKGKPVTTIDNDAFNSCESLTSITIPNSVTTIGSSAFVLCSSLTNVTIGNSVASIGNSAFQRCESLTSVIIPDSVTTIGSNAFISCTSLTHVTIGDSVTSIESFAFADCQSLMSVTIGKSVTSIDFYAFDGSNKIVEIYNKSSLNVERSRFADGVKAVYTEPYTSKLSTNEDGYILYTDGNLVSLIGYIGNEKDLILPNGINEINRYAFYNCDSITSVSIPKSVTTIGQQAFCDCSSLANITVDENNAVYCSIDGNLYSKTEKSLIQYAIGKKEETFTIPYAVTSIADYAFYSSKLTSVNLSYVTSIGYNAFSSCVFLTDVSFRNTPGYWFATLKNSLSGMTISSYDLANSSTAANLLTTKYCDYYWTKEG